MTGPPTLKRSLSLPLVVLYGLGTTIGAGIYALVGAVAGQAGLHAPIAFAVASGLAAFTALSFAELSARLPRSAGEAVYVREGFGSVRLGTAVGLLVVLAGTVSAATISNGFAGYFAELVSGPRAVAITGLVLGLGGVAAWGVRASVGIASALTVLEVLGLAIVVWAARGGLAELPGRAAELLPPGDFAAWSAVLGAALLAFYAFLGFEDMVNVAEEIRDVERVLPRAIVLTLVLTMGLYVLVATAAVLAVPPAELGASEAPLALVYARSTGRPATAVSLVSVVAMVNGALIQIIMASRVLYGLARQGVLPARLARVHPRTRTPLVATALVTGAVLVFALALPLAPLAKLTSAITLAIFTLVNAALLGIKRRGPAPPGLPSFPAWVPAIGCGVSAAYLVFEAVRRLAG